MSASYLEYIWLKPSCQRLTTKKLPNDDNYLEIIDFALIKDPLILEMRHALHELLRKEMSPAEKEHFINQKFFRIVPSDIEKNTGNLTYGLTQPGLDLYNAVLEVREEHSCEPAKLAIKSAIRQNQKKPTTIITEANPHIARTKTPTSAQR